MTGIAFAPGHISAFFEPVLLAGNLDHSGSRGAGIVISLGALSQVTLQQATQQAITVKINGQVSDAPVTKEAIKALIGDAPLIITVDTSLDLPISQGFGMSSSGALSATLAVADILNLTEGDAVKAAHHAEVYLRTGLGDVISSCFGGIEIRREPGLPPWGILEHIPGKYDMVLCIVGEEMTTTQILSDAAKSATIASYGRYCTKKLLEKPTIEQLFMLAREFTKKTGLADQRVTQAIEAANRHGMASMCMLGNSVFAMGDTPLLCKTLSSFGKVICCSVDLHGARILKEQ